MATTKGETLPLRGTARVMFMVAALLLLGGVIAPITIAARSSAIALPVLLFVGCCTASVILFGLGKLIGAVGELRLKIVGD